jgi:hypothetical protein
MNSGDWIVVPNWEKFQHYRDRRPAWIKLYTALADHDEWRHLTLAARGLLVSIWIEYADSQGKIRASELPSRIPGKIHKKTLESLYHAGFLRTSASAPLETEKRREELKASARASKPKPKPAPTTEPRINAAAYRKHEPQPAETFVPLEQIEAYALKLKSRHQDH